MKTKERIIQKIEELKAELESNTTILRNGKTEQEIENAYRVRGHLKYKQMKNKQQDQIIFENLEEVSDILRSFEDWMHGSDGEKCSQAIKLIEESVRILYPLIVDLYLTRAKLGLVKLENKISSSNTNI